MKTSLSLMFWIFTATSAAAAVPEIISGCQGEGCDCFQEYRSASPEASPREHDIPAIRPFTLYEDRTGASRLLGKFEAGTKARPLKQELLVEVKGEYIVERVQGKNVQFKKGDKLDTIINEGEGFARGRKNGSWVEFDFESVTLKVVRKAMISAWMSVKINGVAGFTQDHPFEMCLE